MYKRFFNQLLWGNSIAFMWAWGLGLFFSVQVAIQFGFPALLDFATIDALGLLVFGVASQWLARKYQSATAFENSFLSKAQNYKFAFLLYQFLALTMTSYACLKYISLPLGILSFLTGIMFVGATIFMGEEFSIEKIKYSHAVYAIVSFLCLFSILGSNLFLSESLVSTSLLPNSNGLTAQFSVNNEAISWLDVLWNYKPLYSFRSQFELVMLMIPFVLGFLTGPWLDLQNWQRVHQINKESNSIQMSYFWGAVIFWLLMVVDGAIGIACYKQAQYLSPEILNKLSNLDPQALVYSVKNIITLVMSSGIGFDHLLGFYMVFIALAALATLDSGYIAYRWYSEFLIKDSKNIILSFIPSRLISSPIPWVIVSVVAATLTLHFTEFGKFIARFFDPSLERFFRVELEYFIAFFASFFLVYAVAFIRSLLNEKQDAVFSSLRLFGTGLASIAIFGIGYFAENTMIMAFASVMPVIYACLTKAELRASVKAEITEANKLLATASPIIIGTQPIQRESLPQGAKSVSIKGCYILDSWFVHEFIPTYQDTNSVGNVYFAMYAMWVGKTRELFFLHAMPDFDPRTSSFLILTRSFEHKFAKEIREFQPVSIQIKIAEYNRKFVTLEHRILDAAGDLVGKGKQVLMFVSSQDYALIDLPTPVQEAFIQFV